MLFLLKFLFIFLILDVSTFADDSQFKSYKNYKIFTVQNGAGLPNLLKRLRMLTNSLNTNMYRRTTEILLAPDLVEQFEELAHENQLETQLLVDDFAQVYQGSEKCSKGEFSWTNYYDIDEMHAYLRKMSQTYSNWTELVVGGKTYENRQILGLRIRTPGKKDKPAVFIESGIHAREWIAPATITYFINQLLTSTDPDIQGLREMIDWHIFPSCNPDGYHYSCTVDRMWRKTRSKQANGCNGTDPNRNWDYKWLEKGASTDPCTDVYAGPKVFSEIETKSLSEYIAKIKNLTAYLDFHSWGQYLLIPYSDSQDHNLLKNYKDLVQIGKTSLAYGFKVNGTEYTGPAPAAEILYAVTGDSMDWVKATLDTPLLFTYELRGQGFHWPANRIKQHGDEVTQMILGLVKEAQHLGYFK